MLHLALEYKIEGNLLQFLNLSATMNITAGILLLIISHVFAADEQYNIGCSFYIPNHNMLDDLSGGVNILQSNLERCVYEVTLPANKENSKGCI